MSKFDKLSDDQKEQIKAAFDICDSDQNGFIDIDELKEVLRALGEKATDQQTKDLMKEIDTDGNGLISIDEFCEAMAEWHKRLSVTLNTENTTNKPDRLRRVAQQPYLPLDSSRKGQSQPETVTIALLIMTDSSALEGLSDHYVDVIKSFLAFGRHQAELSAKEIDNEFKSVRDSRLLANEYSEKEVLAILKDLQTVVQSALRKESKNGLHTATELLRQVFKEADNVGFTLKVDVSSIESEESLANMAKVEDKMFSKPAPAPSKLPSLGTNQIVSAEEMVKMRSDNQSLREKLTEMQKTYTSMMKEKSETNTKSRIYQEEIEQLKEQLAKALEERDKEVSETSRELEKVKLESSSAQSQQAEINDQVRDLQEQNKKLQAALEERSQELKVTKKELGERINETIQFQNMKKILTTKNQQLKDLRERLSKYEKTQDDD